MNSGAFSLPALYDGRMTVNLSLQPFSKDFLSDFTHLAKAVFGDEADQEWLAALNWRLENMPDATVFTAHQDDRIIGFKAGYASAYDRYYSWLGGTLPDFRKQGIGSKLMDAQHRWIEQSRFGVLDTHVEQNNKPMISLNEKFGFSVIGSFVKSGKDNLILQKRF